MFNNPRCDSCLQTDRDSLNLTVMMHTQYMYYINQPSTVPGGTLFFNIAQRRSKKNGERCPHIASTHMICGSTSDFLSEAYRTIMKAKLTGANEPARLLDIRSL